MGFLAAILAAAVGSLALAGCGGGSGSHHATSRVRPPATKTPTAGPLTVRPAAPTIHSRITFSFTAPASAGRQGPSQIMFALTIAGPRHAGCTGPRMAPVPDAVKGATASALLPGPWCVGRYTARVQQFARPHCAPGTMCPQYIRLVGTVAQARFRVAAG